MLAVCAVLALQPPFPTASVAAEGEGPAGQEGEERWVPSLAILAGATIESQKGSVDSVLFEDGSTTPIPLQGFFEGSDLAASPFVGGSLEVMSPALPIPLRPRLFLSGEILPTFANDRALAIDGDPSCVRGPEPGAECARDDVVVDTKSFEESSANGEGSKTTATVNTLVYGANLGVAFPARIGKRQLRIKPSAGWISYKIDAEGVVVDAACNPQDQCTDKTIFGFPSPGFLRETILTAQDSRRFNGVGGGLDIEMDTGRFGPLGVSLFLGARAYRVLGDRSITFGTSQSFDDELGMDVANADFEVDIDPWMYRAHVGIRLQWLGSRE